MTFPTSQKAQLKVNELSILVNSVYFYALEDAEERRNGEMDFKVTH